MARSAKRWFVHFLLASIFTTLILVIYLNAFSSEFDAEHAAKKLKWNTLDRLRRQRIAELQQTMFLHPRRPADHTYNINVTLSEHTPLERNIIDTRPSQCRRKRYDVRKLARTTVIIPFYNEALSMLLRTVHSILKRTPKALLDEIILIDDHSPNEDLGKPLEQYVKLLPKVRLVRTESREGLIRARLIGARLAKGKVIMFQDAHTENNVEWLEPMLEVIRKNPKTIIQPHVDQVDADTIEYQTSGDHVPRGGFSWDLRYVWMEMPQHERVRVTSPAQAFRTPTLIGCALAVDKEYFLSIGGFDEGMNVWGGENIELAFRAWMCGGQVLTHPCSRVAHTFKPFSYSFDGDREKIVQKNLMRIAELWMDDYRDFFYAATWNWEFKRTAFTPAEVATLHERMALKQRLGCRPFKWYMQTIIPELSRPPASAVYFGEVTNLRSEACLYVLDDGYVGITYFCFFHRVLPKNQFYIDDRHRLMYRDRCVRFEYHTSLLRLGDCDGMVAERWDVKRTRQVEGMIFLAAQDQGQPITLCITQVTNVHQVHYREQMPQMLDCDDKQEFQQWRWQYKFDFNHKFPYG